MEGKSQDFQSQLENLGRIKVLMKKKKEPIGIELLFFRQDCPKLLKSFLKKGSKVYIEGQLRTRKYTDQAGVEKNTTEVVLQQYNSHLTMLDNRSENTETLNSPNIENSNIEKPDEGFQDLDLEDEVPF